MISRCSFAEDAEKFRKIYNAPTKPLLYSLNLMFSNVPVDVAVVVFAGPADHVEQSEPQERAAC